MTQLNSSQRYFQQIRSNPVRYAARKAANRKFYREVTKVDPVRLEAHRARSRKYARKKRLKKYLSDRNIEIMYLLFTGVEHYPNGGAHDLSGAFKTLEKAKTALDKLDPSDYTWWHVYGIVEREVVESSEDTSNAD